MSRKDPYMERARELCREAGGDPDVRVPKPGNDRGMPLWCTFRDQARAEHVAREQAEIGIPEQEGRYKNAPIEVYGEHDAGTIQQMRNCMSYGNVWAGVICADGHLGYAQPVGGVIAYEDQVSVSGVGYDIACGNMAVKLDCKYAEIKDTVPQILADIRKHVSFGIGQVNDKKVDHWLFDDEDAWRDAGRQDFKQKARAQLGTVGSGNHYVDLLEDREDGSVWIGVHFGSRGLGHTTATQYLKLAGGKDGMNVPPALLNVDSDLGKAYLAAMHLCGRYAYAGREWVVERVRQIIGGTANFWVHNHHNYAWLENHGGRDLWVVRKGATPAGDGIRGFIGGSMGDDAVIVEGVHSIESELALRSTVHGAGRLFGRKEAKRRFSQAEMDAWLQERQVLLSGGDLDESPMAYRRLPEVLAAHAGSIKVLHTLRPFAVAMAGDGEFDPYKD